MIVIVGAGDFGKAISHILGDKEHTLIDIESDGSYSDESLQKIRNASRIINCVPSYALESCITTLKPHINQDLPLLSCTKGLFENLQTPTELISQHLQNPVASLMGPNISTEIMINSPAITCIAGPHAKEWVELLYANFSLKKRTK